MDYSSGGFPMRLSSRLFSLATVLLAASGNSYAQSDSENVKVVIDAYHAALSALDTAKMETLWAHDNTVAVIEPFDQAISLGWEAVEKRFDEEFDQLAELKVTQADGPHIEVRGRCRVVYWHDKCHS
jgi:hypothetical protein